MIKRQKLQEDIERATGRTPITSILGPRQCGGFPRSTLAPDDDASYLWRSNFLKTIVERYIPQLGFFIPSETLFPLKTGTLAQDFQEKTSLTNLIMLKR